VSSKNDLPTTDVDRDEFEKAVVNGNEQLRAGQPAMAALHFQRALDLDSGNARILAMLGLAHFRAGQFAEARPVYAALINRAPSDASHRLNLGLVNLKLGDADSAISMLESSRAIDPSSGRAVSYLGLAYARAGRFAEAYRAFLLAGQHDLALEIQDSVSEQQRAAITSELPKRGGSGITEPPPLRDKPLASPMPAPEPIRTASASNESTDASVDAAFDAMDQAAPQSEHDGSESIRFVRAHNEDAVPDDGSAATAISRAVAKAAPALGAARTDFAAQANALAAGSLESPSGLMALSVYATTNLVRPEDSAHCMSVSETGHLIVRVTDRLWSRTDGIVVTGGSLHFEPATRRVRGQQQAEKFAPLGRDMTVVSGQGYLVAAPGSGEFVAVALDDDILYLREDLVYAFEGTLRWENGNVPGLRGQFGVVQFRGDGAVALHSSKPLLRSKLSAATPSTIPVATLAGWIGRVVPRAVATVEGEPIVMIECSGEGVILIEAS
jgi:tetratricopeptide (TPR) repeat protein